MDLLPKVQLNIVLSQDNLDATIAAIVQAGAIGQPGDGLIFVYPVEKVVRIRTGGRGRETVMYPGDIDEQKAAVG